RTVVGFYDGQIVVQTAGGSGFLARAKDLALASETFSSTVRSRSCHRGQAFQSASEDASRACERKKEKNAVCKEVNRFEPPLDNSACYYTVEFARFHPQD